MKIFLDNYKPISLLPLLSSLEKYFDSRENYIEVFGDTGQYVINMDNIFKIHDIIDIPITYLKLPNYTLILDKSTFSLTEVYHIPNNHIYNDVTKMKYCIKKNNNCLQLVIEGNKTEENENKYKHFVPHNFYFELDEKHTSLENCKDDLFEFLSILN
jgi:hypothetical protein